MAGLTGGGVSGGGTVYGTVTNNGGYDAVLTVTGTSRFDGVLCDGATNKLGLTVSGGSLTLTGPNTYSGLTTVSGGKLVVTGTVGGGATPGATYVPSGTLEVDGALISRVINVNGGYTNVPGSGLLAGSGTITLTGGDDHLYYNSSVTSTFAGTLQGASAALEVDGGSLILTGSNTYGGGTDVNGGMLTVTTNGALPNDSLTIGAGGTFVFDPQAGLNGDVLAAGPAGRLAAVPEPGTWRFWRSPLECGHLLPLSPTVEEFGS